MEQGYINIPFKYYEAFIKRWWMPFYFLVNKSFSMAVFFTNAPLIFL